MTRAIARITPTQDGHHIAKSARAAGLPGYLFTGGNLAEFVREILAKETNQTE